jgi:(p)ppGpp synthase/HD superfamily hydrolase
MSTLDRAIEIAVKAHRKQTDKYGAAYILHPMRVMALGRTEDEKIVGILHDVVEDTDWTFNDLRKEGFKEHIIVALDAVTKREEEGEDYDDFVARTARNQLAIRVKLNDLTDNMDIRRMPEVKEKDIKRLNKYVKAWRLLSAKLDKQSS